MKVTAKLLALSLFALLVSCKKPKEMDDNRPRITSISFAGIPAKDLEFDPAQQIITIRVAELLPIKNIPVTYSNLPRGEYNFIQILLPVKNLYHNYYVSQILLKNVETGVLHGYSIEGPNCVNSCEDALPNRMTVIYNADLGKKLTSGTYQISIRTSWNEDPIVFPQPFVFNR